MTINAASERRFLSRDELELVEPTHYPQLAELDADALRQARTKLRAQHDKARTVAHHKRREARGKGPPRASGASGSSEHAARRTQIFAQALKRTRRQLRRIEHAEATAHTKAGMQRALAMKRRADAEAAHPGPTPHARRGMRANPSLRRAMILSPAKVGRVSKAGKVAQAKRDAAGSG